MAKRPQLKGTLVKVYTSNPRKPNSANRKIAKVQLSTGRTPLAAIKGVPHNLKKFSKVWVAGIGFNDTPSVNIKLIVGKGNFLAPANVVNGRSLYGVKKLKTVS
jgi:small subunit ribosomal protein S12